MNAEQALNTIFKMVVSIDNKVEQLTNRVNKLTEQINGLTEKELPNITFKDFVYSYYNKQYVNRINGETRLKKMKGGIQHRMVSYFNDTFIKDIKLRDVHDFIEIEVKQKSKKPLKEVSLNRYCGVLRAILNKAITYGFLRENVVNGYVIKVSDNISERTLNNREIELLLQIAQQSEGKSLYLMIQIALNTGMRKGEILKLRKSDIIYGQGLTYIKVKAENAKSSKERYVPINTTLRNLLEIHTKDLGNNDLVLQSKSSKALVTCISTLKKSYNMPHFRFHDLRHTFASNLVANGVNINNVKVLLGHSNIRITERYMHGNVKELLEAVERIKTCA